MPSVIQTSDEFTAEVDRLHNIINNDAVVTGTMFSELELQEHLDDILSIQKTMVEHRYTYYMSTADIQKKARFLSIAGVCEFIKEEYVGTFWTSFKTKLNTEEYPQSFYHGWERGFRECRIEMIRTNRREFVQTFVFSSGIPKRKIGEVIDFFVLYRQYLRKYDDVLTLIENIYSGTLDEVLLSVPLKDRQKIDTIVRNIHVSEFTHAFASAIEKLLKIAIFIDQAEEIPDIERDTEIFALFIRIVTGIDPFSILRSREQLIRLFSYLVHKLTPRKMYRILQSLPRGKKVICPDGNTVRAESAPIMYGTYSMESGDAVWMCLPETVASLDDLKALPEKKVEIRGDAILLRSQSSLTVSINGDNCSFCVKKAYDDKKFVGNILYYKQRTGEIITLHAYDGVLIEEIPPKLGFSCSPVIQYRLKENVPVIGIYIESMNIQAGFGMKVGLMIAGTGDVLHEIELDRNGKGSFHDSFFEIPEFPGQKTSLVLIDAETAGAEKPNQIFPEINIPLYFERLMLFSRKYQRQIFSSADGTVKYSEKQMIVFRNREIELKRIHFEGFAVEDIPSMGATLLKRTAIGIPAKIEYENPETGYHFIRTFTELKEYSIFLRKNAPARKLPGIKFSDFQGVSIDEFELVITPVPPETDREELFWNIVINSQEPANLKLSKGPEGRTTGNRLLFSGDDLKALLKQCGLSEVDTGNRTVEFSLIFEGHVQTGKCWCSLYDIMETEIPAYFHEGDDVYIMINGEKIDLADDRGKSSARLRLRESDYSIIPKEYSGTWKPTDAMQEICLGIVPETMAIRLWDNLGKPEKCREMELVRNRDSKLLIYGVDNPVITVNDLVQECTFERMEFCRGVSLESLSGFELPENKITVRDGIATLIDEFTVKHSPSIEKTFIKPFTINDAIVGTCTYSGPVGAYIRIRVFSSETKELDCLELVCRGVRQEYDIEILCRENWPENLLAGFFVVDNKGEEKKSGPAWHVRTVNIEVHTEETLEWLLSKAQKEYNAGRYFSSREEIGKAEKYVTDEAKEEYECLKGKIDQAVMSQKIISVMQQTFDYLNREYLLDV